jgi:hypothetical protein
VVPAYPFRQPDMVFLFVGSSALTEASFPQDLAIPQLLLSSACAIVLTMTASPTAVFPHRGLAPLQFTPMSGAHHAAANPAVALWLPSTRPVHPPQWFCYGGRAGRVAGSLGL